MSYKDNLKDLNDALMHAEEAYKKIDSAIVDAFFSNKSVNAIKSDEINLNLKHGNLSLFFYLINNEVKFFSKRRTIKEARAFYKNLYPLYFFGWYNNLPESLLILNSKENTKKINVKNNKNDNVKYSIEEFIKEVISMHSIFGLNKKDVEDLKIKHTTKNAANYENKTKTIYINPKIEGKKAYYVLLHELMHHFNFCAMNKDIYLSDYDYNAGFREGIAMIMSELLISKKFKFLVNEHFNYCEFSRIRGLVSYRFYKHDLSIEQFIKPLRGFGFNDEVLKTQYVSCLKFPGYKESYYPFYIMLKQKIKENGIKYINHLIKTPNLPFYDVVR
jgi:hypothetical protein